ncbi:MAG: bifunctional diguanylate cyclase/phosphodiesterase [Salinarimonas sp.]
MRAQVLDKVSVIRARLEGSINANIQLVRGLVSVIKSEPDLDQARFEHLAKGLVRGDNQLRNIALAPDLVVNMVYPLTGNRAVLGLDYRQAGPQRDSALRVRDTGKLILAGPVDLVQGGKGFIGRFPIFVPDENGKDRFWGLAAAVIDADKLYWQTGMWTSDIDIALLGRDGQPDSNHVSFGDPAILEADPVIVDVTLPEGTWRLAATPRGGWRHDAGSIWTLRFIIAVAGAILILPIWFAGRLMSERQAHLQTLALREEEMRLLSQRLELALNTSEIGIWELDLLSGELFWDARMYELYDVDPSTASHIEIWRNRLHPDDLAKAEEELRKSIEESARYETEFRIITRSSEVRWIRAIATIQTDTDGLRRLVGVNWNVSRDHALTEDITHAKELAEARSRALERAKERIEFNALHDSLTGLPNRRYLDRILLGTAEPAGSIFLDGTGTNTARTGERRLALLHVDLDRFKQINDTLGHAAGDAMLVHAAEVLRAQTDADMFVARIGGDEFVVFCTGRDEAALAALAGRIVEAMRKPVVFEGHECRFGVSIGIAHGARCISGDEAVGKRLLIDADIALYRAKKRGRNRYEFFTQALQAEIVETKKLADDILRGMENDEFEPFYQPQFDARSREIVGVEALLRWRHPNLGLLTPDRFMRVAEELNVVSAIDRLVLEQGLRDHAAWRAAGLSIPTLSVNVSARRLHDEELIQQLRSMKIAPGIVAFELVESIFLDEEDEVAMANIDAIKKLGIDIEIDDFGTGYGSIVSLMKLQPARLKIDRQFIAPIMDSSRQRRLVRSIIDIGQSLGIGIVAEGVESLDHATALERMGCDILQGYAFARPMTARTLVGFVRGQQWKSAPRSAPVERPDPARERLRRAARI